MFLEYINVWYVQQHNSFSDSFSFVLSAHTFIILCSCIYTEIWLYYCFFSIVFLACQSYTSTIIYKYGLWNIFSLQLQFSGMSCQLYRKVASCHIRAGCCPNAKESGSFIILCGRSVTEKCLHLFHREMLPILWMACNQTSCYHDM